MNRTLKAITHYYAVMTRDRTYRRAGEDIVALAAGIGLGAGLMYLWDPDRGRRRRNRLVGEASGMLHRSEDTVAKYAKDVTNRVRGLAAKTAAEIKHEGPVDDVILIERVKSKMGHLLPHSHGVEVQVRNGAVSLKGKLPAAELRRVLEELRAIPGVKRLNGHFRPLRVLNPGFLIGFAAGMAGKAGHPQPQMK